jgi:uridine phosphorylase
VEQRFRGEPIAMGNNTDREAYTLHSDAGRLTLIYSGMGSPVVANALEKAAANGVERVVLFGACGGAAEQVKVGDLVVPAEAVRGEGTSRYYMPPSFPAKPDADLATRLSVVARERCETTVHHGDVFTTDASYRQGPEVYERREGAVLAVDCECSATFVVASALSLQAAAIFFCTDNVLLKDPAHQRRQGLESDVVRRSFQVAADVAVAVLMS